MTTPRKAPEGYKLDDNSLPTKSPWLSKTLWTNVIVGILAFMPWLRDWVGAHPQVFIGLFALANIALRWATKGSIQLYEYRRK